MSKSYNELMDKIEVTEDMKNRILQNLDNAELNQEKIVSFQSWKKYLSIAACFALLIVGITAFNNRSNLENPDSQDPPIIPVEQDVFGFTECSSFDELEQATGMPILTIDSLESNSDSISYGYFNDGLTQIDYLKGDRLVSIRVSEGSEDNSGDYTDYSDKQIYEVEGINVEIRGENGQYHVAVWENNGYSYSIYSALGEDIDNMKDMIDDAIQH